MVREELKWQNVDADDLPAAEIQNQMSGSKSQFTPSEVRGAERSRAVVLPTFLHIQRQDPHRSIVLPLKRLRTMVAVSCL